ncbi:Rieske (2Fe-2S) protein [Actinotalea lenta]|uniref:Rieske (2Fe-2S) protein n=1 Tax=Actinotalea lenta TaxID=3064654 RepID=UPI00272B4529|nr:non-heme iron oxygenase ferredoxin subunit [Isoptericola sp. b490]
MSWVRGAALDDIEEGGAVAATCAGVPVCLARSGDQVYALIDRCSHQDVPLSAGEVEDGAIECYLHGSRFDLATGKVLGPPAVKDVRTFPVRTEAGQVYVGMPHGTAAPRKDVP